MQRQAILCRCAGEFAHCPRLSRVFDRVVWLARFRSGSGRSHPGQRAVQTRECRVGRDSALDLFAFLGRTFAQGGNIMERATYSVIANWVKKTFGWVPKTCWIAHMKELCGLPVRKAPNRGQGSQRQVPCPEDRRSAIHAAFVHFGL